MKIKTLWSVLDWRDSVVTLKSLHSNGGTIAKVSRVELIGADGTLSFVQDESGLTITPNKPAAILPGIADQQLASGTRVLRITHDKGWFNGDDPGALAPGRYHLHKRGIGLLS